MSVVQIAGETTEYAHPVRPKQPQSILQALVPHWHRSADTRELQSAAEEQDKRKRDNEDDRNCDTEVCRRTKSRIQCAVEAGCPLRRGTLHGAELEVSEGHLDALASEGMQVSAEESAAQTMERYSREGAKLLPARDSEGSPPCSPCSNFDAKRNGRKERDEVEDEFLSYAEALLDDEEVNPGDLYEEVISGDLEDLASEGMRFLDECAAKRKQERYYAREGDRWLAACDSECSDEYHPASLSSHDSEGIPYRKKMQKNTDCV